VRRQFTRSEATKARRWKRAGIGASLERYVVPRMDVISEAMQCPLHEDCARHEHHRSHQNRLCSDRRISSCGPDSTDGAAAAAKRSGSAVDVGSEASPLCASEGLATVFRGAIDYSQLKQALKLPQGAVRNVRSVCWLSGRQGLIWRTLFTGVPWSVGSRAGLRARRCRHDSAQARQAVTEDQRLRTP
jgi:hypothetical protein